MANHTPREAHVLGECWGVELAAFLGLGLLSTSFAGFAQNAHGGVTSWRGGYDTAVGAVPNCPF